MIIHFYNDSGVLFDAFGKRERRRDMNNSGKNVIKILLAQISTDFLRFPQISPDLHPPPNNTNLTIVKELPHILIKSYLDMIIRFYNDSVLLFDALSKGERR